MKTKSRACLILSSMFLIFLINSCSKFEYFAGSGIKGFSDGSLIEAKFNHPTAMDVDDSGNLYVVDQDFKAIRKITADGKVSTILNFKEGGASSFKIKGDFLYFSNAISVKRFNLKEVVKIENIVGGDENGDILGDFEVARFNNIDAITLDNDNNIFFVDKKKAGDYSLKKANLITRKVEVITFEREGSVDYNTSTHYIGIDSNDPTLISRGYIEALDLNPKNNQLYFMSTSTFDSEVFKINSKNQILNFEGSERFYVGSFTFDDQGNMYIVAIDAEKIFKVYPDNKIEEVTGLGGVLKFQKDSNFPETGGGGETHLAFDNNKKILYMSSSENKIFKLNLGR
jgi:hypothetical protein